MTLASVSQGLVPLVTSAGEDLLRGLGRWDLWGRLGWLEVKRRYRRTMIGPFWSTISLGIFVGALGAVGSGLWNQNAGEYLPFLSAGMVVWIMLSTVLNEAGALFVGGVGLFRQTRFDYSILVFACVWRNFITFLHNLLVYIVVLLIGAPHILSWSVLLAVPGLLLLFINEAWMTLLLGMFCLRFRDVQQLVSSLIQIAMFITPIFWSPEHLPGKRQFVFVTLNPLYHLIQIVRAPLVGQVPTMTSYTAVLLIAVAGWGLTYAVFVKFRKRIAYWS